MNERGWEREEREIRLVHAYESIDRLATLNALGVPATLDQIVPERRTTPARSDASGAAPAESFGSESVDLAGILTEGEAK